MVPDERSVPSETLLSIGALSERTGLAIETIRTWERRYGYPVPIRRPSGHRRYRACDVERLCLVRRALEAGHRPSRVVGLDTAALQNLLWKEVPEGQGELIGAVMRFDGPDLERRLRRSLSSRGLLPWLDEVLLPLLREIGERWAAGALDVAHEHFASERIEALLRGHWTPLSDGARRGCMVLAALPRDEHVLGLHMAAWVLASEGFSVHFLGARTPTDSVLPPGREAPIGVLTALGAREDESARREIQDLRDALPGAVQLLVGGARDPVVRGAQWMADFSSLQRWAREGYRP